jgi:hypothetical protein
MIKRVGTNSPRWSTRTLKGKDEVRSYSSGQGKNWHGRRAGTEDQGGSHPNYQRRAPGFQAYYVIYAPDDTTAISIFDDYGGAQESNKRGLAWIERNLAPLLTGPATAVAGPVIVHTLA